MAARSAANDAMFLNNLYGGMDEPEIKIIDVAPVSEQARLDVLRFQWLPEQSSRKMSISRRAKRSRKGPFAASAELVTVLDCAAAALVPPDKGRAGNCQA
jgi:hypothetical protein